MPKIIVMNSGAEQMSGHDLTSTQHQYAAMSAWRSAWFADNADIIVSPVPIDQDFLNYIGQTLNFDADSVLIFTPNRAEGDPFPLTDKRLLAQQTVSYLQKHVTCPDQWTVMPCYHTRGVAQLSSVLGIKEGVGQRFAAEFGSDLLNRKSHFRQLATGAELPLARGTIVNSPTSLANAIRNNLVETGTVIVKKDNGAAGEGNITITRGPVAPLPGSRETRGAKEDIEAMASSLWSELTDRWNQTIVVEVYYKAIQRFYLEFVIDRHGTAQFLSTGTIRLRPESEPDAKALVWAGLDIPADLPAHSLSDAISISCRFVTLAARLGYRGPLNIDAILTERSNLLFNEVNARWGGGSVLHNIAERLLGSHYANEYIVSSLRNINAPSLQEVLEVLRTRKLHFNATSAEGVIVLASDQIATNTMECLIIGSSREHVREMETTLFRLFQ